jgi:hypothetical protein
VYDPAIAGKQVLVQKSAGHADKNDGNKKAGQNVPAGQGAVLAGGGRSSSAAQRQQQGARGVVQQQGAGQPRHQEDDGNSALARAGYQLLQQYQQGQQNEQCQPEQ